MIFSFKLSNIRHPWWVCFRDKYAPTSRNMFILRQDHFSNYTIMILGLTLPFFISKTVTFSLNSARMTEPMLILSLRKDHFIYWAIRFLGLTPPFLIFKNIDPIRHRKQLVSETRMYRFPENMFIQSLRQEHFIN